jgi:D-amino-acid dehydrogenase
MAGTSQQVDCIVLGAGIIGVSIAVHLAQRGRSVVLVDRRTPGEETSFGNAGLIQREGVHPYAFPLEVKKLLQYSLNNSTDMIYRPSALPGLAPFLARYWWHSQPKRYAETVRHYAPLIEHCISEHDALIRAAGAERLVVKEGWYRIFRTAQRRDMAFADADLLGSEFGIGHRNLSGADLAALEPGLQQELAGGVHWTDPWSINNPNGLVLSYFRLFQQLGGIFRTGDATSLAAKSRAGWQVDTMDGTIEGRDAIVALGPWADRVTKPLGYRLPLAVKRGYHMHYAQAGNTPLTHWMLDAEPGYLLAPMTAGVRLTTGAEFAQRDAPKHPIQLDRLEVTARALLPLGKRLDPEPWMGARPMTPDMLPVIGPAARYKGLWFAFGHGHHGLTLGPVTGRLIAEAISGETPFLDISPYRPERFD